jgi:hypothetical protein
MMALLIIVGTLGIYSAEASSFRATIRDAQVYDQEYDQLTTTNAYDDGSDDTLMVTSPGLPY